MCWKQRLKRPLFSCFRYALSLKYYYYSLYLFLFLQETYNRGRKRDDRDIPHKYMSFTFPGEGKKSHMKKRITAAILSAVLPVPCAAFETTVSVKAESSVPVYRILQYLQWRTFLYRRWKCGSWTEEKKLAVWRNSLVCPVMWITSTITKVPL